MQREMFYLLLGSPARNLPVYSDVHLWTSRYRWRYTKDFLLKNDCEI